MIAETIAYLETNKTALGLKLIGGGAEFQALVDSNAAPTASPAAYVIPVADRGGPNALENAVLQKINAGFAIVWVAQNAADRKGAAATLDMIALRKNGLGKLLGWAPTTDCDPLEFDRGALMAFKNGHLWWQDVYRTSYLIKGA